MALAQRLTFRDTDCIFLIPSQIAITYFRPNLWLPCLEIGWGILTGLIAMSTNVKQVYALRAFLGVFESSAYPGTVTLLSKLLNYGQGRYCD
jgi:MFS family permease